MFNSLSKLLCQFGIIYFFGEFILISYTMSTQDLLQNSSSFHLLFHCLILFKSSISSLIFFFAVLYNVSLLFIFEILSSFFLFLFPTFLGHMAILVVVKILQLSILEIIIGLSDNYRLVMTLES